MAETSPRPLTRRTWLAGTLAAGLTGAARAQVDEGQEIRDLVAGLKRVGIDRPRLFATDRYLAVGNGTERFIKDELDECERLARCYLRHYRARGFDVKAPAHRMTVVALANARDFFAYLSECRIQAATDVAGIYHAKSNRLVVYLGVDPADDRARITHEATHQLTFNTGLLAREADLPKCVGEGFGCYGECRQPEGLPEPGQRNYVYLDLLRNQIQTRRNWIPLADLFRWGDAPDAVADQDADLAYAESWILIHYLMNTASRLPGLRRYLAALNARRDSSRHVADSREHLGDLEALEVEVKAHRDRWLRA